MFVCLFVFVHTRAGFYSKNRIPVPVEQLNAGKYRRSEQYLLGNAWLRCKDTVISRV